MPLDTPGDRRARDEAMLGPPDDPSDPVVASAAVEVYRPTGYGRRSDVQVPAMVASAARIDLRDKRSLAATRKRRQAWQTEAWDYFDEIGEIGYTTTYIANLMSKLRLYPAIESDDGPVAVSLVTDEGDETAEARKALAAAGVTPEVTQIAIDTLRRLRSQQGGQSAIIRELSLNLEVAGECFIHGHLEPEAATDPGDTDDSDSIYDDDPDPTIIEDWNIRSVDELVISGDEFQLRRGPGVVLGASLSPDDLVIRIWERHPRFSEMATCAMRRILAEAEALLLLSREIRATSKSRLSNGILLIPSELSFGPIDPTHDGGDGEEAEDPFDAELQEAMITPIQEEGSASAVVPLVLRGPAEILQHVNHLALDKTLDPVLDARIEQRILRIARGLNMPTEVTTGLMATTFANAVQIKRSEFEDHVEPRAVLVCDAITSGYFQWALEVAGVDRVVARQIFVWYDASSLIKVEDQSEMATKAHEDGVISDAARRRYTGFKEEDAPDVHELAMRILLKGGRIDPTIFGYLLRDALDDQNLPIPAPAAGVLGIAQSVSGMPAPGAPPRVAVTVGGDKIDVPPEPPAPPPAPPVPAAPGQSADAAPPATEPATPSPAPVAAAGSVDRWARLGSSLVGIDRELRSRVTGKLDHAMQVALERAGNKIRARVQRDKGGDHSALRKLADEQPSHLVAAALGREAVEGKGLSDSELLEHAFDGALVDVRKWMQASYARAVAAVEKTAGAISPASRLEMDARSETDITEAIEWLKTNLQALAGERLYTPIPADPGQGETDPTVLIPANLVRAAISVAGGDNPRGGTALTGPEALVASVWSALGGSGPVTSQDGSPLGGIGTGPLMMGSVVAAGGSMTGWQWDYGEGMRSEFPPHVALDGTVAATTDDPVWANQSDFPATDYYFPGDHDGCFPVGTEVSGPAPVAATLREWKGELVEVRTASGQFLAATPNHPVLTPSGWVPVCALNVGDEVVRCIDGERITGLVPNHYQVPASIEKVADTFGVHSGMTAARVEVAAEHFHGDGAGSQIAVVGTDRHLRDRLNAALGKPASQDPFGTADPMIGVVLPGQSGPASGVETVRPAALGLVGSGSAGCPTFGSPADIHEPLRFADGADADPTFDEPCRNRFACSAEGISEGLDRLAGFVSADKIIHVERHPFEGHVYNLDTRVEWYIANGILVRNCVCDIIPVLVGPDASVTAQTPTADDIAAESVEGGVLGPAAADTAADEAGDEAGDDEADEPA